MITGRLFVVNTCVIVHARAHLNCAYPNGCCAVFGKASHTFMGKCLRMCRCK